MKIAVTSQNRKTITEHAGRCRKFWIFDIEAGSITSKNLVELPIEQSFHASRHELASPLSGINVLISGSMGTGLYQRLREAGIRPQITTEESPEKAVAAFLAGHLELMPPEYDTACGHQPAH
jgi:predicted Fe-Mo cluster-binding NifX family protein